MSLVGFRILALGCLRFRVLVCVLTAVYFYICMIRAEGLKFRVSGLMFKVIKEKPKSSPLNSGLCFRSLTTEVPEPQALSPKTKP